jgi:hypothetical protein
MGLGHSLSLGVLLSLFLVSHPNIANSGSVLQNSGPEQ